MGPGRIGEPPHYNIPVLGHIYGGAVRAYVPWRRGGQVNEGAPGNQPFIAAGKTEEKRDRAAGKTSAEEEKTQKGRRQTRAEDVPGVTVGETETLAGRTEMLRGGTRAGRFEVS